MNGPRSLPPKIEPIDIGALRPPFAPRTGADAWLYRLHRLGIRPGLEAVTELLGAMGDPHREVPSIVVGGTNGKGTVAHALAALMRSSGLRVGLYTSPHLLDPRERIQVNGRLISEAELSASVARHQSQIERHGTTFFESLTAMALEYFRLQAVDVAVLEAGLGGRLDATNVVEKRGVVITSVGYDHQELLGDSLEAIALEKLGLAARNCPLYVMPLAPELRALAEARAAEVGAEFVAVDATPNSPSFASGSARRRELWSRSLFCAEDLARRHGWTSPKPAEAGEWGRAPCRYDRWGRRPELILDTAHNAHALIPLLEEWSSTGAPEHRILVLGFTQGKPLEGVAAAARASAQTIVAVAPGWPRAISSVEVKARLTVEDGPAGRRNQVLAAASVREGLEMARSRAGDLACDGVSVLVTGSNFVVAEALDRLGVEALYDPIRPDLWDEGRDLRRRSLTLRGIP